MSTGWRYRVSSVGGTAALTVAAVALVNHPAIQETFALVPFFGNPAPDVLGNGQLEFAIVTVLAVIIAAMWPLYKPRPRRILDTIMLTQKRLLLAMVGMAALGYFKWSHRLPRSTLMLSTAVLLVALPLWHLVIRRQPKGASRALVVGDNSDAMRAIVSDTDLPIIGYVGPPAVQDQVAVATQEISDGGRVIGSDLGDLECLGGLSRLDDVLVEHDVDTVLLAFARSDRSEFFGTLGTCHDHGVSVKAHRDHADSVLLAETGAGEAVVNIEVEPWDWQTHAVKRLFDVGFAAVGLLVLSPAILIIAAAVRLDNPGPILYSQERTAEFGERFTVYKFRSMVADAESDGGATLSAEDVGDVDPRVTRVGRFIRRTHLDEIPQLWSILVGDMSVVGPRPERPELDDDIEASVQEWRRRWFVKPGLTGLAQIRGATGHEPAEKLRHDLEYVRRQSFWFDLKIVVRQVWQVLGDAVAAVGARR